MDKEKIWYNENGNEYYNQTFWIKHSFKHRWHRVKMVGNETFKNYNIINSKTVRKAPVGSVTQLEI